MSSLRKLKVKHQGGSQKIVSLVLLWLVYVFLLPILFLSPSIGIIAGATGGLVAAVLNILLTLRGLVFCLGVGNELL